jgi:hypothetical protein
VPRRGQRRCVPRRRGPGRAPRCAPRASRLRPAIGLPLRHVLASGRASVPSIGQGSRARNRALGQPCQKQPSTNTATLARVNAMCGRIGRRLTPAPAALRSDEPGPRRREQCHAHTRGGREDRYHGRSHGHGRDEPDCAVKGRAVNHRGASSASASASRIARRRSLAWTMASNPSTNGYRMSVSQAHATHSAMPSTSQALRSLGWFSRGGR